MIPAGLTPPQGLYISPEFLQTTTLAEIIKEDPHVYFFLEEGFRYQAEVFKYFDGDDTLARSDGEEFLTVLEVVLDATDNDLHDGDAFSDDEENIEGMVRERFLELYRENYDALAEIRSSVHQKVDAQNGSLDLASQVLNFINGDHPQEMVAKYHDRLEGKVTEKEAYEFLIVYSMVIQTCPFLRLSDSPFVSRSKMVRKRFDELYAAQKCQLKEWDYFGVIRVEKELSPPSPLSVRRFPNQADWRPPLAVLPSLQQHGGSFKGVEEHCLYEDEVFLTLKELEEYDFGAAGLGRYKDQIIGFYNGTMSTKEGLFEVLKAVFGCYPKDVPKDSFEGRLRKRFEDLFLVECQYKPCALTPSQKDEIWKLMNKSILLSQGSPLPKISVPPRLEMSDGNGGGGSGGTFVKVALVLLGGYLAYRFVGKPFYQWYRKETPLSRLTKV